MFTKHINNLRNKSESYRHTFAISVSLFVTIIIFVIWVSVMKNNLFISPQNTATENVNVASTVESSPIQSLKNGVGRLMDTLLENATNFTESLGKVEYIRDTE